ncbi:MAG: RDD family protein [Planctomycetota bacterium]
MAAEPEGVYYANEDYAGPLWRFIAWFVDVVALIVVLSAVAATAQLAVVPKDVLKMPQSEEKQLLVKKHMRPVQVPVLGGFLVAVAAYHVLLRRTRFGTPGYLVTGIRIVDETGEPPPLKRLGKRFLLAIPFTLPLGASYLKCRGNPKRQSVHDQICGTWVIRRRAQPAGPAQLAYLVKLVGLFPVHYIDVEPFEPVDDRGTACGRTAHETHC